MHPAIESGRTAVITGGASGIGLAVARLLHAQGMQLCLADINADQLNEVAGTFDHGVITQVTDVADLNSVEALRERVLSEFGEVAILMNNAGRGGGGGSYTRYAGWQKVLGVNLWGVVHGLQTFTELMIGQNTPCAIINTGSKQGITNPPGDAAYNVSKAGVKSVTESLAHELRQIENCQVTAHLLVPGFTYTGLIAAHVPEKPAAAWTSEQVAELLLQRMGAGDFYVICPDNDVDEAMDLARMQWNLDDVRFNRPALSRWHADYQAEFEQFIAANTRGADNT